MGQNVHDTFKPERSLALVYIAFDLFLEIEPLRVLDSRRRTRKAPPICHQIDSLNLHRIGDIPRKGAFPDHISGLWIGSGQFTASDIDLHVSQFSGSQFGNTAQLKRRRGLSGAPSSRFLYKTLKECINLHVVFEGFALRVA